MTLRWSEPLSNAPHLRIKPVDTRSKSAICSNTDGTQRHDDGDADLREMDRAGLDEDRRQRLEAVYTQIDPKLKNELPVFG